MSSIFWESQKFAHSNQYYDVLEILRYTDEPIEAKSESFPPRVLVHKLKNGISRHRRGRTLASLLQLLKLDRNQDNQLLIGADEFREIFRFYGIDPFILYLVVRQSHGCYHSRHGDDDEGVDSFYLNSVSMMLLWSYQRASKKTFAIIIPRQSNSIDTSAGIYAKFLNTLGKQKELFEYPWYLQLASVIEQSLWLDVVSGAELQAIRHIEERTRHGNWVSTESPPEFSELIKISEKIGFANAALANAWRQADLMLNLLAVNGLASSNGNRDCDRIDTNIDRSKEEQAKQVAALLRTQITIRKDDISYLQKRAENQSSVIFGLISLNVAESAKLDSSAMKIIAVMTMLFLPGTFFATLFAVPSLKWDEDPVITDRFWVYVVFTIPSTLFILILYKGWKNILIYQPRLDKLYEVVKKLNTC
ncbi:hypothetical protein GQX73_g6485 [Xylaria multiplex]|uniref:Uncharacterized protein n=1 Tax=Xylaria multiplex TaxID=323545 RepID=A0A7C8MN59_9PEZI|nr:hypothetical protein GQX73_g6485 [Xylaria multiplex]